MTGSPSYARQRMVPWRAAGSVLGRDDEHVVAAGQLATELERVDLRAGDVPRQKIVDRVEEPQPGHSPLPLAARASC